MPLHLNFRQKKRTEPVFRVPPVLLSRFALFRNSHPLYINARKYKTADALTRADCLCFRADKR